MKQSRYYKIEFWIDCNEVPFSREVKAGLLDLLFKAFNGMFTPERYNTFEPVNKTFLNQDELIKLWNDEESFFFLKKISPQKMDFIYYDSISKILGHSIYRLIFWIGKKVRSEIIEEFLIRMIDTVKPSFCFATSDLHWEDRCRVKYIEDGGTCEHLIFFDDERFCGIFWRTYFSKSIVAELNWAEKLDSLPCECQKLPDGYMLKVNDNCFDPDWEKEEAVINSLGRKYIADIKTFYDEYNLIPADKK